MFELGRRGSPGHAGRARCPCGVYHASLICCSSCHWGWWVAPECYYRTTEHEHLRFVSKSISSSKLFIAAAVDKPLVSSFHFRKYPAHSPPPRACCDLGISVPKGSQGLSGFWFWKALATRAAWAGTVLKIHHHHTEKTPRPEFRPSRDADVFGGRPACAKETIMAGIPLCT